MRCNYEALVEQKPADPLDKHLTEHIAYGVACLVAQILVLSLLDSPLDTVRLLVEPPQTDETGWYRKEYLPTAIQEIITSKELIRCTSHSVIEFIIWTIGHTDRHKPPSTDYQNWITTSKRGQVLLPHVLLDMSLQNNPCLGFVCLPGVLSLQGRPKGELFKSLISLDKAEPTSDELATIPSSEIKSLARFSDLKHDWLCRVVADSVHVYLSLKEHTGPYARISPRFILHATPMVLFIPNCNHPQDVIEPVPMEDYAFVHPDNLFKCPRSPPAMGIIRVYAVRGNEPVRLMVLGALCANTSFLVGFSRNACLRCSLAACRRAQAEHLIC